MVYGVLRIYWGNAYVYRFSSELVLLLMMVVGGMRYRIAAASSIKQCLCIQLSTVGSTRMNERRSNGQQDEKKVERLQCCPVSNSWKMWEVGEIPPVWRFRIHHHHDRMRCFFPNHESCHTRNNIPLILFVEGFQQMKNEILCCGYLCTHHAIGRSIKHSIPHHFGGRGTPYNPAARSFSFFAASRLTCSQYTLAPLNRMYCRSSTSHLFHHAFFHFATKKKSCWAAQPPKGASD